MPKITTSPKTASINVRLLPEVKAEYTDAESMAALQEAKQLINEPNAKTYNNVKELFADCLSDVDDDD